MEETVLTATIRCKLPLSDADLRWIEADITRRLQSALVQKLADITFTKEIHGTSQNSI